MHNCVVAILVALSCDHGTCTWHLSNPIFSASASFDCGESTVLWQTMSREQWEESFNAAAVDGLLNGPGAAGLLVLCDSNGMKNVALGDIEKFYENIGKTADADVSSLEFFQLLKHLGCSNLEENNDAGVDAIVEAISRQRECQSRFEVRPDQLKSEKEKKEAQQICEILDAMKLESAVMQ